MNATADLAQALDAFKRGDLDRARSLAEREMQSAPSPMAQHLLGLIHCRRGDPRAGIGHLEAALASQPDNVQFRVMLARALVDAGRYAEALRTAAPPKGTSPPELALWHARAEAADAIGDAEAALEAWAFLCKAGIRDWRAWASYGDSLGNAGRWRQAVEAYRQACELEPGDAASEARRGLAIALAQLARDDEAADELLRWIEHSPSNVENRLLLARLLVDLGRESESREQLDKAAKAATGRPFPESGDGLLAIAVAGDGSVRVPLLIELARILERTNRIDALRKLIQEAEAKGVGPDVLANQAAAVALRHGDATRAMSLLDKGGPKQDPLRWHWLKARVADSLGDPDTAFAEARKMNELVAGREKWLEISDRYIESVRAVSVAVTPEWAGRIRPLVAPPRCTPAFLVGFPRSGTTLLDTFLMGHPDVAVLEEIPLMTEAQRVLGDGSDLPERSAEELEEARNAYLAGLDRHIDPAFAGLVVDKLPLNMLAPRFIHTLFPDSKFVFAQRHPCDCVLSCYMQPFALNESMACFLDLERAAEFYDAAMTLWTRCAELLPLEVHTLVYEDLVANPEGALRPLVEFLGLEWRAELLDHRSTATARGAISTPSYAQVVQPVNSRASGRWRRYEKQLEPVLPLLLPWADRLGYPR